MNNQVVINFLVCFALGLYKVDANNLGIVGGQDAGLGQYPWQISLQYFNGSNNVHFCSGSLINSKWVLTAAHCFLGSTGHHLSAIGVFAVGGITDLATQNFLEQRIQVETLITHRLYDSSTLQNDIALLNLTAPFSLNDRVKTVALPTLKQSSSGIANVSGWGASTPGGDYNEKLQWVAMDILSDVECQNMVIGQTIFDDMICTYKDGNGPCDGDSGGPVIAQGSSSYYQAGIVSWGTVQCGDPSFPSVHTEVSYYVDWIALYVPSI